MSALEPSQAEWDAYGGLLAASEFAGAALGVGLVAIQIFMVLYGLSAYIATPINRRKGRLRFVVISWVILTTSAIDTFTDVRNCFRVLYTGGPTGQSYTQAYDNVYVWDEDQRARIAGNVMLCITIAVGDALMLWRCFILWKDRKWVVVIPTITCIGAVVLYGVAIPPDGYVNRPRVRAIIASASLGVATNIMVTSLILIRLAMTWFSIRKSLPDRKKSPQMYAGVAAILIESAAPLALFGICFITTTAINYLRPPTTISAAGRSTVLSAMFDWLYYLFCALSPQMIIFRVATGQSWKNSDESKDGTGTFSKPIEFARGQSGSDGRVSSSNMTESVLRSEA
ncbi:hypothetical protein BKA70DRAFT_1185223 [Coprinopsis sp. MPI-PUGE-AT-0042]|nr:hypothetical protein BKA70DRAFT_1185223 [Coprinopsis sp. MPI-PUGE-AT-0042]